jgi:hypothetical protein
MKTVKNEVFCGEFWSRSWESDVDLSDELSERKITTPFQRAIIDACLGVEKGKTDSMAKLEIKLNESGNFVIKAWSFSEFSKKEKTIETNKCPKCGVRTYTNVHPFNGCECVVVEQVMTQ